MIINIVLALIFCCIGFKKYVYFLSIGYGFAISSIGIRCLINSNSLISIILSLLLVVYGCRLSGFLLYREFKNKEFKGTEVFKLTLEKDSLAIKYKVLIWIGVSILYTLQTAPVWFRVSLRVQDTLIGILGLIVMIVGLAVETIADLQKSKFKKTNSGVCTVGLYKIVRCPNYFGEIVFWCGVFLTGIPLYSDVKCLVISLLGLLLIIFIMFNGAKRLEKRQLSRYENNEEFKKYHDSVPIIIPLLPLYSLKDVKFL